MIGHGQQQRCGRDEAARLGHQLLVHGVTARASAEDRRVEERVVVLRHLERLSPTNDHVRSSRRWRMLVDVSYGFSSTLVLVMLHWLDIARVPLLFDRLKVKLSRNIQVFSPISPLSTRFGVLN